MSDDATKEQLTALFKSNPKATLCIVSDNDAIDKHGQPIPFEKRSGEIMAVKLAEMAPEGMPIVRATPLAKDWNDDLTNMVKAQEQQRAEIQRLLEQRQSLTTSQVTREKGG